MAIYIDNNGSSVGIADNCFPTPNPPNCLPVKPLKVPFVSAPITPVTGGTSIIQPVAGTTTIQNIYGTAIIAAYNLYIAPLGQYDVGNVVISTITGITSLGLAGVPSTALSVAYSSVTLTWNGGAWVIAA